MKVLLINGSSHSDGSTYTALMQISKQLNREGIETEIIFIGNQPIADCMACGSCRKQGKCVFDDLVNEVAAKALTADGFIFGSPVYYAHPSGRILSFLDRLFYSAGKNLAFKPAAAVVSARRAGNTASFDVLNKYFTINQMPVVSSTYWNNVHGNCPQETLQDLEGLSTMTNLAKNMAWLLKCIELGKEKGINHPINSKETTNFIR